MGHIPQQVLTIQNVQEKKELEHNDRIHSEWRWHLMITGEQNEKLL